MVFRHLREWNGVGIEPLNNLLWLWNCLHFPEWVIATSSFSVCAIMHKTPGSSTLVQYQCLPTCGVVPTVIICNQTINYHSFSLYTLCCINAQEARRNQVRNSCRKYDKGKIMIGKTIGLVPKKACGIDWSELHIPQHQWDKNKLDIQKQSIPVTKRGPRKRHLSWRSKPSL